MTTTQTKLKPWMRPRYLEWRKEYERSPKYKAKVRAYHAKRRTIPRIKVMLKENARRWRERHKLRILVGLAIARSERAGIECDIEFLKSFSGHRPENCVCCGVRFDYSSKTLLRAAPSLDRVDSRRGYVRGNVAVICWRCNVLKKDGSISELEAIVAYMRRGDDQE